MSVVFIPSSVNLSTKICLCSLYAFSLLALFINAINSAASLYRSTNKRPDGNRRSKSPLDAYTIFVAFACLLWLLVVAFSMVFWFWIVPLMLIESRSSVEPRVLSFIASMLTQVSFFGFTLSVYKRWGEMQGGLFNMQVFFGRHKL